MSRAEPSRQGLATLLRALKLPAFVARYEEVAQAATREGWSFEAYLRQLAELEASERQARRIDRLRKQSGLLPDKTLARLDLARLPIKVRRQLPALCEGAFLGDATNLLAFGLPGRGKTHLLCAIGHELVARGHKVLFRPTALLVQQLLAAKRELCLEQELKRLDRYEAVLLDDIGYVQQDREEMEVLFTFFAARYERRSVLVTSNLLFSQWERIFKDPMTTAAAIDRLVHHSVILELTGPSVREEEAKTRVRRDGAAGAEAKPVPEEVREGQGEKPGSSKKAASKKVASKKVASKKVASKKVASKKVASKKAASKKVTSEKVASKKVASKRKPRRGRGS